QEKSKSLANTGTEPPAKPSLESGVQVPPVHKPDQKNSILADKFKEKAVSLNDLIQAHKADKSIGSQMQNNPISNLKTAIGINEKFIFVYELFSGDTNLYHEAIEALNSRASHADAIQYLEELHQKFHWDIENAAFHKLIDLVNRRYAL
ncbi:MAG: hypothetical protein RQ866_08130, partial [Bacteroidales bacterium]|nr:hypothetical protein [Bacteroidales bacterium]